MAVKEKIMAIKTTGPVRNTGNENKEVQEQKKIIDIENCLFNFICRDS